MQGTITIIQPDGTIQLDTLTAPPLLDDLQMAVGGFIELVPGFTRREQNKCIVFCNEDGKNLGLPPNPLATEMWSIACPLHSGDVLVGPVVIIEGDDALLEAV